MPAPLNVRRRSKYSETMDDFPTPPWLTRAFMELVIRFSIKRFSICEPACGRGYMLNTLKEYSPDVRGFDIKQYGDNHVFDYLKCNVKADYMITNPPFALAEQFAIKMLQDAKRGVGLLVKSSFAESAGRYDRLFSINPPTSITILSSRMPGAANKIVRKAPAYLSHSWFYWDKSRAGEPTTYNWFSPDTQQRFERNEDYA